MNKIIRKKSGFTLVEVIIDAFIVTAVFGALVSSFIMVLRTVNSGQVRVAGASLANEQTETLRNLPYDSLSTQHGTIIPQGSIQDTQTLTRSSNSFIVNTTIIFVDDPFDGCAIPAGNNLYQCTDGGTSSQQDLVPFDYKRLTITVAQATNPTLVLTTLSSNVAAKAAETPSNTGMLLVLVKNAQGQPVGNATVTVTNTSTNISVTAYTNLQGYVFIAGLPPDTHNGYHIVTSYPSYSTDMTYTRTPQNPNQFQPDVSVSAQQITTQTLSIDQLSTMNVQVLSDQGSPISGVVVTATGSKITQNNPVTSKNIYSQTTDSNGNAIFSNAEWDGYTFTLSNSYSIAATSPYQPTSLSPGVTLGVDIIATSNPNFPQITTITPSSVQSGQTVSMDIDGNNFSHGTTVVLRLSGQTDVLPTSTVVASNQKLITVTFDLGSAPLGDWDVVITSSGNTITQKGGVVIQ